MAAAAATAVDAVRHVCAFPLMLTFPFFLLLLQSGRDNGHAELGLLLPFISFFFFWDIHMCVYVCVCVVVFMVCFIFVLGYGGWDWAGELVGVGNWPRGRDRIKAGECQ